MKKRYVVLIICIWIVLALFLGLFCMLILGELGIIKPSPPLKNIDFPWGRLFDFASEKADETETKDENTVDVVVLTPEQSQALYEKYFDLEIKHRPSEADMNLVREGMTVPEIVEILGKPHEITAPGNFGFSLKWHTDNGKIYYIYFDASVYGATLNLERCMTEGIASSIPLSDS